MNSQFEQVYKDHHQSLTRYLCRMVGPQHAEDLAQETYIRGISNFEGFKGNASLKNWMFRIAGNLAIDKIRRTYNIQAQDLESSNAFIDIIDERPWNTPQELMDRHEMTACIAEFVNNLQPHYKAVIILRELDNFDLEDISDILEISYENARVRLHRAREALRNTLSKSCHIYQGRIGPSTCERK